ncbi:hypothetical protein jhhlp_005285 [Lomentospora prolificans]|uniref:Zn(2)-C6 fungal-type domain-containing protein n=1 Tax=Lomentospora prolificans TaxID=41688 RepID=A0A2N3N7C5_9PEZI|nr:hypothetical protein jhhlp_005285 [Lomentospora prolificans]
MDPDFETDSPSAPSDTGNHIPAYTVLEPGTSAPTNIPSTAPSPPAGSNAPASPALNPRSCVTCRRRKVRCDKRMPCSNCRRNQIQCIFPAPGRAPRRPRPRDPEAPLPNSKKREIELLERLRKLEGIVEELSSQVDTDHTRQASMSTASPEAGPDASDSYGSGATPGSKEESSPSSTSAIAPAPSQPAKPTYAPNYEVNASLYKKFGRLVINKGKGRYISSAFWSSVKDEFDEIRSGVHSLPDELDYTSDEETSELAQPPDSQSHDAFLFGYRACDIDLSTYHPPPDQIPYLWQIYKENVEPAIKLIHMPSLDKIFQELVNGARDLTPPNEALVFAIYFAALVALEEDEVEAELGSPKAPLLVRYRFALEQALAKTNLLRSLDLTSLTALTLFLAVVRRHDDTRFCWTATGLLIRIAQGLGLHRDGTQFNLPPFETEMRRRVWWVICGIDMRSAEEMGTDLTIVSRTFDTEFPTNINDEDISPESTELPPAREGLTDSSMAIVRHEVIALSRRLFALATAAGGVCPKDSSSSMAERERMLVETYARVEANFLRFIDGDKGPLVTMATLVARILMAKSSLIIYQPALFPGKGTELSDLIKERLFVSAVEIIEYTYRLNNDPQFKRWRWLFQTYTQWHAIAYILLEMCRRPWSATMERAWNDLNRSLNSRQSFDLTKTADHLAVWMPLRKLLLKARRHRQAEIERLKANPEEARKLDKEDWTNQHRPRFGRAAPDMDVDLNEVRERWLALVQPTPMSDGGLKTGQPQLAPSDSEMGGQSPGYAVQPHSQPLGGEVQNATNLNNTREAYLSQIIDAPFDPIVWWRVMSPGSTLPTTTASSLVMPPGPTETQRPSIHGNQTIIPPPQPDGVQNSPALGMPNLEGVHAQAAANIPPWLWPHDPFSSGVSSDAQGPGQGPVLAQLDGLDDGNMNIDEFNWQSWGDTVRGLRM